MNDDACTKCGWRAGHSASCPVRPIGIDDVMAVFAPSPSPTSIQNAIDRAVEPPAPDDNLPKAETVNHPAHYAAGGIEAIDVIEAWDLGFCTGNAVKYLARAGRKPGADLVEDLKKARWYIDRAIAKAGAR